MHVELGGLACNSTCILEALPGKTELFNNAFSKRSLVNLISKDTHLVFSIYFCLFNS